MKKAFKIGGLLLLLVIVVFALFLFLRNLSSVSLDSKPVDKKKMPLLYNQLKEEVAGRYSKSSWFKNSVYVTSINLKVQSLAKETIKNYYSHFDCSEASNPGSTLEMLIIDANTYTIVAYTGNPNVNDNDFWSVQAWQLLQGYTSERLIVGVYDSVRFSSETYHAKLKPRFDEIRASGSEEFESYPNRDVYFLLSQDYLTIIVSRYIDDYYRIEKNELKNCLYRPFRDSLRMHEVLGEHLMVLNEEDSVRYIYPTPGETIEISDTTTDSITNERIIITKTYLKAAFTATFENGKPVRAGKSNMRFSAQKIDYYRTGRWHFWNDMGLLSAVKWYDEEGNLQDFF